MSTRCDLYVFGMKNVWVERGDSPNDVHAPGVCMLDSMNDDQIVDIIEHDPVAREDLRAITTDPHLLNLANVVPTLPQITINDQEHKLINDPQNPASIPFYAIFRGQPPFAQ